jgi:hypothetical protein
MATPFQIFWPRQIASYPASLIASAGNSASAALSSCKQTTSGLASRIQLRRFGSRRLTSTVACVGQGWLGAARAPRILGEAVTRSAYGRAPLARDGANPGRVGVVSHEPEPSAEHPVKGRSPGADLITAIASRIFHWHVRHGMCPQSARLWCGNFLGKAVIV